MSYIKVEQFGHAGFEVKNSSKPQEEWLINSKARKKMQGIKMSMIYPPHRDVIIDYVYQELFLKKFEAYYNECV